MNSIKPIQTRYKGYHFRSRLEARWAVFFDSMGIRYEYEPEGYELSDGSKYLPDFYLPMLNTFFEVKPSSISEEDEKKAWMKIEEVGSGNGSASCLVMGPPGTVAYLHNSAGKPYGPDLNSILISYDYFDEDTGEWVCVSKKTSSSIHKALSSRFEHRGEK